MTSQKVVELSMECFYKNSLSTIELSEFFFLNVKKSRGSQFLALVYIGMVFRFVFENKQTNVFLQEMVCQQCLLFSSKTRNIVPFFFNLKEMFFFFFDRHAEAILDFASSVFSTFLDKLPTFVHVEKSLPENENR